MKKLMMMLGVVALAASVNAATVMWGGAFSTPDVADTLPEGTQFALLYSTTAFTGDATSLTAFAIGGTADNGGTIVALHSINATQSENWEFSVAWDNTGRDVNGYYAILALNDAGDAASYMYMGDITGTTATSPQSNKLYNEGWANETASLTTGGYTVAVPEPTSGLLLLLGMAGLALKRKRA